MTLKTDLLAVCGAGASDTYVDDVFSTYTYTGNGGTKIIDNGIALTDKKTSNWASASVTDPDVVLSVNGSGTNNATNNTFVSDSALPAGMTGAIVFSGVGSYVNVTTPTTAFSLGWGDYTVEAWVYLTSYNNYSHILEIGDSNSASGAGFCINSNGKPTFLSQGEYGASVPATVPLNTWTHVVWERYYNNSNAYHRTYINGVGYQYLPAWGNITSTTYVTISGDHARQASSAFSGMISNLRVVKGTAVYTSDFTPSFSSLTAVTGTSLLTAQNNTLVDNSTNAFAMTFGGSAAMYAAPPTITRSGNVTQGTFSPFSQDAGKWSAYFDGSGDCITTPNSSALSFGTGDFCIEGWFLVQTAVVLVSNYTQLVSPGDYGTLIQWNSGNIVATLKSDNSTVLTLTSSVTAQTNVFNHIAYCRSGTTVSLFLNGTRVATGTSSVNSLTDKFNFGGGTYVSDSGGAYTGYMSNIRVCKGSSPYSAASSTIPVPTSPLSAVTNTTLLCLQDNRFKDNSTNNFTLTPSGNVKVSAFSPFSRSAAYSPTVHGGSGYFDGAGDWITTPNVSAFDFSATSSSFTIEAIVYVPNNATHYGICGARTNYSTEGWCMYIRETGRLWLGAFISGYADTEMHSTFIAPGTWNHVAIVRTPTAYTGYVNGIAGNSISTSTGMGYVPGQNLIIGALGSGGEYPFLGHISSLRIVKGTALYTSNFTPPTGPLTAVTNTSLLLNFTNSAIKDESGKCQLETVGDAKVSTAISGAGAIYLDGTGDWLHIPAGAHLEPGAGNFTLEFSWYPTSLASRQWFYHTATDYWIGLDYLSSRGFAIWASSTGTSWNMFGGDSAPGISNIHPTLGAWNHIVYQRSGNDWSLYLQGKLVHRVTASGTIVNRATEQKVFGSWAISSHQYPCTGYFKGIQFTRRALYSENFTPPTVEYPATHTYTTDVGNTGKGGLVWLKSRSGVTDHALYDTVRGATSDLVSHRLTTPTSQPTGLTEFKGTGFALGSLSKLNTSASTYVSWTFAQANKFFKIVQWTGDGASTRNIACNMGGPIGCVIVRNISVPTDWYFWHRSLNQNSGNPEFLILNTENGADTGGGAFTTMTESSIGVRTASNTSANNYVAYVFGHDTSPSGLIQCGGYAGNSSTNPITLGWEPQWILIRNKTTSSTWMIFDTIRGLPVGGNSQYLVPSSGEAETSASAIDLNATGFSLRGAGLAFNTTGNNYVYIAIRRSNKPPTSGTQVLSIATRAGSATNQLLNPGFAADMCMTRNRANTYGMSTLVCSRITGAPNTLKTDTSAIENTGSNYFTTWDAEFGYGPTLFASDQNSGGSGQNFVDTLFKRSPGVFDIVCFTGIGSTLSINHGLGVPPELFLVKNRAGVQDWYVYNVFSGSTKALYLDSTSAVVTSSDFWANTPPSSSVFTVGAYHTANSIAYLFATKAGISKVGSYTGNNSNQTINCGFTTGARFILIKRTDASGNWYIWDSARGIVAGNDPYLSLNTTVAEVTTDDSIDPDSTGFIVNQVAATNINVNAATYIYLAFA